jgi:threonine dehydrogenase-like Zn-dependent dehydrogenase
MKAVTFTGNNTATLVEVAKPNLKGDEVLVKVAYAGICGSDIALYKGLNKRAVYPIVPGHEFVGTIAKLPENYQGVYALNDAVVVIPTVSCGKCWACMNGLRHTCNEIKFLGIQFDGGFREYANVPLFNIRKVPQGLPLGIAVLAEPLGVCIHAVNFVKDPAGKKMLVFGAGPIGLTTAIRARELGAEVVIAELSPLRRKKAEKLGFTVIDSKVDTALHVKNQYTAGIGFDVFFECAGHPSTFDYMILTMKQHAQMVIVATFKQPPQIDIFMLSRKEMHIDICWTYYDKDIETAISLLLEKPEIYSLMHTDTFGLDEADLAMQKFIAGGDSLKVLFKVAQE